MEMLARVCQFSICLSWTLFVVCLGGRTIADDFPQPINTEPANAVLTSPEEALQGMEVPEDFQVTLFASEPDIHQPIALATDDAGRLWVAENYTYSDLPTNFDDSLRDRIVILEDTNHDGKFDKRKVFWDKGKRLTSIEIGYGGVWVLDAPNLLFIPDADGDDVPDGEPVVMLDGWDSQAARHTIVNGLRWGPDGWLYGRNGIMAISNVGVPGASPDQRTRIDCGIWRFHPTRHQFEVVSAGTTNPWGMDWDQNGQMFFINTVIGHLWHVVPGARYRRMYGEHFNPHTYGVIEQTADHFHWDTNELWHDIRKDGKTIMTQTTDAAGGGHAHCGMMILQGDAFPADLQQSVLALNLHGRRINRDTLHRHGATYTARHAEDFLKVADPWFRGVEILAGRAGEIYIADWSDVGECHENDGIHRTSGRIYRLTHTGQTQSERPNVAAVSDLSLEELIEHVDSGWEWLSRKCLLELSERTARGEDVQAVQETLRQQFRQASSEHQKLRLLWALNAVGAATPEILQESLRDPSEHVRVWAIQLLAEADYPSPALLEIYRDLAVSDDSGLVVTWLASNLQRLKMADRWAIASAIAQREEYANDRVLPLMLWFGIEPAVLSDREQAVQLALTSKIPLVREYITRRVTQEIDRQPEFAEALLASDLVRNADSDPAIVKDILLGMTEALRGWRKGPELKGWSSFAETHSDHSDEEISQLVRELSLVFGDGRAMEELRAIVMDGNAPLLERRAAIQALVLARDGELVPSLQQLIGDRYLAADAITGLASFSDPKTPNILVGRFNGFNTASKRAAIATLASRPAYATVLIDAVAAGNIERKEISAFQLRQMQNSSDPKLAKKVAELWPELEALSEEKTAQMQVLRERLSSEKLAEADLSAGRALFVQSCVNCHTLFGEGKKIGPELTGAQRNNLNYLLENIVDPSATVSENFRLSVILMEDGRVLNGVVVGRTEKTLTVQTATEQLVVQRQEIEEMQESKLSLMPENLIDLLTETQVRDLFAYLMSPSQVPLPQAGQK